MKSKHPDRIPEYLQHILDAINRALGYVAAMNVESFNRDTRTQDAVIRSIQIIGEAANKVRTTDPGFAGATSAGSVGCNVWDAQPGDPRLLRSRSGGRLANGSAGLAGVAESDVSASQRHRAWPMTARRKSPKRQESFAAGVGRGMRRAARTAREVARRFGTPIYVWENGKVVAKDPNDDRK